MSARPIAYYVAATGGRKAFERWGAYVLVRPHEIDRAEQFFARYGSVTVFVGRLLPVVRTFIAFPAGLARMPMLKFQIYTFLGSWPWCFGLAYIGYVLGARWNSDPTFRRLFHEFDGVAVAFVLAGFAWFVWTRWRERAMVPDHSGAPTERPVGHGGRRLDPSCHWFSRRNAAILTMLAPNLAARTIGAPACQLASVGPMRAAAKLWP